MYCTKCGSPLNEKGKCPKCDVLITPKIKKKAKKTLIITIIVLSVYTVTLITLSTLVYFDKLNIPFINDIFISMGVKQPAVRPPKAPEVTENTDKPNMNDENNDKILTDRYRVTPPDAEEYFSNNSTVISEFNAIDSTEALSESQAYDILTQRGFVDDDIVTDYFMDGQFEDDMTISPHSSEKHPIYQTYYVASNEDIWSILIVNNTIIASPVSYNMEHLTEAPITISETDSITSYDSTTNKFFVNKPNETVMRIKKVQQIDSATLDRLTKEEIDKL